MKSIYDNARDYDRLTAGYTGEDLPFYERQLAQFGDPALELACGTGRMTIPLAQSGLEIEGLDISQVMLDEAKVKAEALGMSIPWHLGDITDFDLERQFSVIFIPNNSAAHLLHWRSLESCLRCVKKHLQQDGRFILDYFNPSPPLLVRDHAKRYFVGQYDDPAGAGMVTVTENNVYDWASQINHLHWYFQAAGETEEQGTELQMRVFYPQELDALLHYNGFEIEAKYGGYDESGFTTLSRKQLFICRLDPTF